MHNKKKITLLLLSFIMIIAVSYRFSGTVKAEDSEDSLATKDGYFTVVDEDGNIQYVEADKVEDATPVNSEPETYKVVSTVGDIENVIGEYDTYEEAAGVMELKRHQRSVGNVMIMANDSVRTVEYGIVRFRNKGTGTTAYTEVDTGRKNIFFPGTAADAAYISTSSDGKTIRVKLSGVVMDVAASDILSIEPYTDQSWCSSYRVENGVLLHETLWWSGNSYKNLSHARVGYKLDYLQSNVDYFSYDGHYFYSNYKTMINDYRNGNYNNAINADSPYYNYYQYLSHRTESSFLPSNFNQFVTNTIGSEKSGLQSQGAAFIASQNKYTTNAGLMFGVAINESDWGRSDYAANRNNLFGHNAVDSDPDKATYYDSVLDSINGHAYDYISKAYLNAINFTYRGPHLGDKQSGMNVKYASDVYWGEKAASSLYKMMDITGNKSDYNKYTIGILKVGEQWFYKEANPNTEIYSSATTDGAGHDEVWNFPVTILGKVTGTDGKTWYKIQSDTPLTADRSQISPAAIYDRTRDYVYIPASSVSYLSKSVPDDTGMVLGDVNGNGRIDAADYLMVMDNILGKYTMNDQQKKAGDVNKNGKIDAADYLMIMDCILGKITIN